MYNIRGLSGFSLRAKLSMMRYEIVFSKRVLICGVSAIKRKLYALVSKRSQTNMDQLLLHEFPIKGIRNRDYEGWVFSVMGASIIRLK